MQTKKSKFKNFIKSNLFYTIVVGVVLLAIGLVGVISTPSTPKEPEPLTPVDAPAITYTLPLQNYTVLKDYSDSELMYNATLKRWESHKAIDLSASEGANVVSVADGKVTQVYNNYLDGTVVVIEHANNMKSLYSSLNSAVKVKVGDEIKKGDVIGQVSTTANGEHTDGSHLHFEFYRDGVKVNPNDYIAFSEK